MLKSEKASHVQELAKPILTLLSMDDSNRPLMAQAVKKMSQSDLTSAILAAKKYYLFRSLCELVYQGRQSFYQYLWEEVDS